MRFVTAARFSSGRHSDGRGRAPIMADFARIPSDRKDLSGAGSIGIGRRRLLIGGILFLAVTIGIFWYQFHRIEAGTEIPRLGGLRWGYLPVILLLLPVEPLLSGFRMWTICRVLQPGISYATCIKAELANQGMALLTPSQSGGGAGQIYMLARGGARVGTALTVGLLAFVGTMTVLLGMGVFSLLAAGTVRTGPPIAGVVFTLTLVVALIVSSLLWPGAFRVLISGGSRLFWRMRGRRYPLAEWRPAERPGADPPADRMGPLAVRLVEILYVYRDDLRRFLRHGKAVFAVVCVVSLGFLLSRFTMAFLCVRFLGIPESSLGEILVIQSGLLFLTYFAPTPGSAGIAEGASLSVMSGIVSAGYAPYYNLLWRFSTVYLTAATGLFLIGSAVVRDMRGKSFPERKETDPADPAGRPQPSADRDRVPSKV
jgi:glycosyltransferase 2 family protein